MKAVIRKVVTAAAVLWVSATVGAQTVQPTWESLNQRGYPQWFNDAKLGIFVHWGLYSVPAYASVEGYGEWFYRGLMTHQPGRMKIMAQYADTTLPVLEQYRALTDYWHAELWQPQQWAQLFRQAGAQYVMLVTKHHDGYCLWDSPQQPQWNSTMSGPRRNIVEELTEAVRQEGLRMCFYYSLPEWSNPLHIWMDQPPEHIKEYVDNYMIPQFKDLVTRYKPDAIFSDGDWENTPEQLRSEEIIAWYYNTVGPDAIVNNRWGKGTKHGFLTPEYSAGIARTDVPWAECRGLGRSFGLNRGEKLENYMTATELVQHFCELVAHGGGMTLNVGPAADGTIPLIQQERLLALGHWLQVNGEAIYASRPYIKPMQGSYRRVKKEHYAESVNFNWVRNAPLREMTVDNFDIIFTADITVEESGIYTLRAEGNDEISLLINGEQLLHATTDSPDTLRVEFKNGQRLQLQAEYREVDLEAVARLQWRTPGQSHYRPIEADWSMDACWYAADRCFTTQGDTLYVIEFERPGATVEIPKMERLPKGAKVQLLGTTALCKWKQKKDGALVIDLNALNRHEVNALDHAWVFRIEG